MEKADSSLELVNTSTASINGWLILGTSGKSD